MKGPKKQGGFHYVEKEKKSFERTEKGKAADVVADDSTEELRLAFWVRNRGVGKEVVLKSFCLSIPGGEEGHDFPKADEPLGKSFWPIDEVKRNN